jgi:hypothetical protein
MIEEPEKIEHQKQCSVMRFASHGQPKAQDLNKIRLKQNSTKKASETSSVNHNI